MVPRRSLLLIGIPTLLLGGDYQPIHAYDPNRDAQEDLRKTIAHARETGKRILLEVGGKWCSWCHLLDKHFVDRPALTELREKNFVLMKVNFSPENENKAFLSQYPNIPGYPHLFVLDSDGTFLHSQETETLEEGKGYSEERIKAFLNRWAPAKQ